MCWKTDWFTLDSKSPGHTLKHNAQGDGNASPILYNLAKMKLLNYNYL
jgi:hypothetical protein